MKDHPRKTPPIHQQMILENRGKFLREVMKQPRLIQMSFLSEPTHLVLKDNWEELFLERVGEEASNCPDFQTFKAKVKKQFNVVKVNEYANLSCTVEGTYRFWASLFKQSSEPYLKGE